MTVANKQQVHLFVGTHKGAFRFSSSLERKTWELHGPFLKGTDVNHIIVDQRNELTVLACVNSEFWGAEVKISGDLGETWRSSKESVKFDEDSEHTVKRIWNIAPGINDAAKVLYVGVDPAALFISEDNGETWKEIKGLSSHPTRDKWSPGAGGLMVHSICPDPVDSNKMYVGISAAGTFYTGDGGKSWEPRNKGVRADFLPEKYPEVGQCVHHLESHSVRQDFLYQQNHCGVYRSENGGKDWTDISGGLPSRFGFPLVIHPHDPDTIYVIPEEGAE